MTAIAQSRLERECSLSNKDWLLYHVYYHPSNKKTSLQEIRSLSLNGFLDFKESLEAISLLEEAAHKDAEMQSQSQQRTG